MSLRSRNKVSAEFSMSSLTDIIFLLLIFFMLTSTMVSPNALKLLLPSSNSQTKAKQNITISIDENKKFYVGQKQVQLTQLAAVLKSKVRVEDDPTVVLNADKSVPIEEVVKVMNIANDLKIKMILATKPQK